MMNKKYAKYLLEKTSEDYNKISKEFARSREKPWKEMSFLFDHYLKSGEKALDLGCGHGRFYHKIKEKGAEYFGLDNSEKLIEIAKNDYPGANFQTGNALVLPFFDNFFDKIYSIAVLHHIPSRYLRIKFLMEAKRVLSPGGILILTVWDLWSKKKIRKDIYFSFLLKLFGFSKLDFKDVFYSWKDNKGKVLRKRYIHVFSQKELHRISRVSGFEIKEAGEIKRGQESNFYLVLKKPELDRI